MATGPIPIVLTGAFITLCADIHFGVSIPRGRFVFLALTIYLFAVIWCALHSLEAEIAIILRPVLTYGDLQGPLLGFSVFVSCQV